MTKEEKQKAIDALKISAPIKAMAPNEFNDYIKALNKITDGLEQATDLKEAYNKGYKDGQEALEYHIELCKEEGTCDYYDSYNQTCRRSDVPKEPCEDAISREWLKTAIHNFYYGLKHIPTEEDIQAYIDVAPSVTPKPKTDVLDKIIAEIHSTAEMHEDGDYYLRDEWVDEIIDKYKAESEDKE